MPKPYTPAPAAMLRNPWHCLSFGFGSGLAPVVPGTFGTLVGMGSYWLAPEMPVWVVLCVSLALFVVGVPLCSYTTRALRVEDHRSIVWDEITGYWITMSLLPKEWEWMLAGFVLFRLLDTCKPFPINWIDKNISGGWGIMLDDVLAGLVSCAVLLAASVVYAAAAQAGWIPFL